MRCRGSSGFTLVELMIVVGIAGVLAGLAAYSVRYRGATAFSEQKAILMDALTQARNAANLRSECVRVRIQNNVFNADTFTPDVGRRCGGPFNGTPAQTFPAIDFGAHKIEISPFSDGTRELVFNPVGGLVVDRMITFEITDSKERATFRIYPAIGQIRVN